MTYKIPRLYATEHIPLEKKIIYQRYQIKELGFYWLIAELDKAENLAFGYANLNNDVFAEWGYISIDELLENNNVVAILCIQFLENALYLSRIGVKTSLKLKGYGKQLMKFAVQKAVEKGFRKITLEAQEEVIQFFKQIGFVVVRKYADTYWGNSATMELSLGI